jgi:hypothetical protein
MQKKISDFCSATLSATPPAHSAAGSKPVYSDTLMWR